MAETMRATADALRRGLRSLKRRPDLDHGDAKTFEVDVDELQAALAAIKALEAQSDG